MYLSVTTATGAPEPLLFAISALATVLLPVSPAFQISDNGVRVNDFNLVKDDETGKSPAPPRGILSRKIHG